MYPCTCGKNYWILPSGVNTLKGCSCDPCNPIRLDERHIVYALQRSTVARKDFMLLFPSLFPCEKDRFITMFRDHPWAATLIMDHMEKSDREQTRLNEGPIWTAGKQGGTVFPNRRLIYYPPTLASKFPIKKPPVKKCC